LQTDDGYAVRTAEVIGYVMKDAVQIMTSAVHPGPAGSAQAAPPPPAFVLRTLDFGTPLSSSQPSTLNFPQVPLHLGVFALNQFPGAREKAVPNRAKSCQKVPCDFELRTSAFILRPSSFALRFPWPVKSAPYFTGQLSAFYFLLFPSSGFTNIKIEIGKEG